MPNAAGCTNEPTTGVARGLAAAVAKERLENCLAGATLLKASPFGRTIPALLLMMMMMMAAAEQQSAKLSKPDERFLSDRISELQLQLKLEAGFFLHLLRRPNRPVGLRNRSTSSWPSQRNRSDR